ncbi:unnamed protein product [Allacma fusca]|uniref:Reverse transcriptase RNase H-like domain-containing protein n=1 Tax=Allacma fusca TaxID=39272 RepID=A0A8J2P556_9HEXA|nr:unnamed protein product [Allacma fusca]
MNETFVIQTDASGGGLGSVLTQVRNGKYYPVWFASKSLNPAQKNYSTSEQECLAVIWAIKKFRGFIEFSRFIVETDHQALCWLRKIKEPVGRLARWSIELQGYDFDFRYRKGILNQPADAMSRVDEVCLIEQFNLVSRKVFIKSQHEDLEFENEEN